MPSGLWSGLVQGLGGSLQQGFQRKHDDEMQQKQNMFHLVSSALMNDDTLPGTARREGLRQLGMQYGVKIPDELIAQLVPDTEIETDKYQAEMPPQGVPLPQMPAAPQVMQQTAPGDGKGGQAPQQAAPQQGGEMQQGQQPQPQGQILPPMPRDPFTQGPQVLGSGTLGQQSASPVVQQYTSGHGSNYDDLDLTMQIKQLEQKLSNPPSRQHSTVSSLNMSRAQMNEMKGRRMQQDQMERDLQMNQYQNLSKLKTQHEEQVREIQLQPLMIKAKLDGIQQAMGRTLTDPEKGRVLGINSPEAESRAYDAKDYQLAATQPDTPEGQAALARVKHVELQNTGKLLDIQQSQAQIAKLIQEMKDPMSNPRLLARAKVESVKSAEVQWTITDQQQYLQDRSDFWEKTLSDPMAVAQSGNAEMMGFASLAKDNPMVKRKLAIQLAQKDVQQYKQNLQDKIFTYGVPSGGQVITLHWLRRRAQYAQQQGGDPNKLWDYWKDQTKAGKATILDDNLDIWSEPVDPNQPMEYENPFVKIHNERKKK